MQNEVSKKYQSLFWLLTTLRRGIPSKEKTYNSSQKIRYQTIIFGRPRSFSGQDSPWCYQQNAISDGQSFFRWSTEWWSPV